ncbi:MAG: GntR family transcriptional regulator [Spirochaetes bacterium]|nr:GntR family transcriptional regulator [Spirochaetota bacterium]
MVTEEALQLFPRDRSKPIHRWVYEVLRLNIIQLHMKPGRLLSETEVADLLSVSRTPVREAFIRLAEDGLLDIVPQKGSIVSLIDLDQAQEARFVRLAVEREILKGCCTQPIAVLEELEDTLKWQEMCGKKRVYDQLLLADNEFHRILFRLCGKERVWDAIKKLDYNYDRLRVMTLPIVGDRIIVEHREIVRLIKDQDRGGIEELLNRHLTWEIIEQVVLEYPPELFMPRSIRVGMVQ